MNNIRNKGGGSGKRRNIFSSSLIISTLGKISSWIIRKLSCGLIGSAFCSYRRENDALSQSAIAAQSKRLDLSGRLFMPAKGAIARGIETSVVLCLIRDRLKHMMSASMKAYGIFTFSFTLYSTLIYLFRVFYFGAENIDYVMILSLLMMLVASVMMISSRHTLASALLSSPASRFFLFRVVGIRREVLEGMRREGEGRFNIAFIAGIVFGVASFFVHPLILLCLIGGLVCLYLILIKPEFGVLAIMCALPFVPTMALVGMVLYTALCYMLKVLCGKRSIKFDLLDIAVAAFLVLIAMGGIVAVSSGSMKPALVFCAFMLGYFLVVNLIRSAEWVMRCVIGLISSSTVVALYGLFQNFFGLSAATWHDKEMFGDIEGRVVSTFENPNVLAEYLIMIIPLCVAMLIITKHPRAKLILGFAALASCGCLVYTWSRGAWLGFIIGMLIFFLMYHRNTLTALLFGLLGVPFLPFVLPDSIIQRFASIGDLRDTSTAYRVNIWKAVTKMIGDFWQTGVGVGEASFKPVYSLYALSGIETAPHSHNLYLQITVELGIVGLVVFAVMLFVWAQSSLTLHKNESRPEKLLSAAVFCGMLAVLAQGLTDYIWYNYRVFFMFWLVLGLGSAIRKTLDSTAQTEVF